MENYKGLIDVEFEGMPSIRMESFKPSPKSGMLERLAIATRRRRFSLIKDWTIALSDIKYSDDLNGTVEIPTQGRDQKTIVFDGASIPLPWLVSLLTVGILRPLGVILTGSIVHDYAYKFGQLRISKDGSEFTDVPLARDRADRLFRDIVGTVNGLPFVGYIAWYFVRIGWVWVKYDGKRFGGKAPVAEYVSLVLFLCALCWMYTKDSLGLALFALSVFYVILNIASVAIGKKRSRDA